MPIDRTTNLQEQLQTKSRCPLRSIPHEWSAAYSWSVTQTSWRWTFL